MALFSLLGAIPLGVGYVILVPPRWLIEWVEKRDKEAIYSFATEGNQVALTIDDVPFGDASATEEILKILKEFEAHATFFVLGEQAKAYPDVVRAIVDEGHEIGNHGMVDRAAAQLTEEENIEDLQHTKDSIQEACRDTIVNIRFFRPGHGKHNAGVRKAAAQLEYSIVLGTVYPHDPQIPSSTWASYYCRKRARPGDIIILHDRPHAPAAIRSLLEGRPDLKFCSLCEVMPKEDLG